MSKETLSLSDYWFQWQVLVSALILIIPTTIALRFLKRGRGDTNHTKYSDLWHPCWRNLHPIWLLFFRAFAFASMALMIYQTVVNLGFFVFLFYTQWTCALVMVYFALATVISARGCWSYSRNHPPQGGEGDRFLNTASNEKEGGASSINSLARLAQISSEQRPGFWGNFMLIIYQTCGGAVMLTDIVFWCLLLPFMTGENFKLTVLIGCMHSVNAIFLLLDSALNNLDFPWYGLIYFVLWSCSYVVFQWTLHACCINWWPYPFLELQTPWAPLWYFALALVHLPCYGIFVLLIKAKGAMFSKMFPEAFLSGRIAMVKKQT